MQATRNDIPAACGATRPFAQNTIELFNGVLEIIRGYFFTLTVWWG
jgi:hypothetical protein